MPTYEYKCPECSYSTEIKHKINDNPSKIFCPRCDDFKEMNRGVGGGLGFQLKCNGFYDTDYKGK